MKLFKSILLTLIISTTFVVNSQEVKTLIITKDYDGLSWNNFVKKTEANYDVKFYYHPDSIPDIKINVHRDSASLLSVLNRNLRQKQFFASMDAYGHIFITKNYKINTMVTEGFFDAVQPEEEIDTADVKKAVDTEYLKTRKEYVTRKVTIGSKKKGIGSKYFTVSGYVTHAKDGSPIIGGTIYVKELETGTATGDDGYYQMKLRKGNYTFVYNSIDSKEQTYQATGYSDGKLDVVLDPDLVELDEVEIFSGRDDNVRGIQMGYIKLDAKNIKEIPVVLGERDILKVALLMPGVQTVGEGSSGFNVRGSPADQNMFYLSKIPVYNSSHFFGFFSAFNPDVVDEFTLYKSNIPAYYGGRLSSIFDIDGKNGNQENFSARGGISPITARLMVEGPIAKGKLSYLAGIRATYSDWVLKMVKDPDIQNSNAYFGDAVINLTYNVNKKNRISLYGYFSRDNADLSNQTKFMYENLGGALSWFHIFSNKLNMELSLDVSNYSFEEQNQELEIAAYNQNYALRHNEIDLRFNYTPNDKHIVTAGIGSVLYNINNGDFLPLNDASLVIPKYLGEEKGLESNIYISDEWKVMPNLIVYGGLRFNYYSQLGPATVYNYQDGKSRTPENIIDTLYFSNNQSVKSYNGIDYRVAATYMFNPNMSVKASYNRLHQYIFMLSNTIALAPTDKWKLADYYIEPMVGDQVSVGLYTNLGKRRMFEFSLEAYYKKVNNLVEYKDGANLIVNEYPERDILQGKLDSYGVEFMVKKTFGRLNGWFNYTYSRSIVQVVDSRTGEFNNFGIEYPANWDKPHAFNFVVNYKISKRLSFSADVVYSTGRPITYPTAIYYQDGQQILHYSLRNEYRLPDYFRVDASVILEGNLKKKKFLHGSWIFSVYNLTGRKNAYSIYFTTDGGQIQGYKLSIFGVPIFSLTYDFKLGNYND